MSPASRERTRALLPILAATLAAWLVLLSQAHLCCARADAGRSWRWAFGWVAMVAAMMLPLLGAPIRHVWDRSFARHRARRLALFLGGYVTVWLLAGVPLAWLSSLLVGMTASLGVCMGALVALAWHASPARQHCVNRLHAHGSLTAFGLQADVAALVFGLAHGVWCVGSCWAVMLLADVAPADPRVGMLVASLWIWVVHFDLPRRPQWGFPLPARGVRLLIVASQRLVSNLPYPTLMRRSARP